MICQHKQFNCEVSGGCKIYEHTYTALIHICLNYIEQQFLKRCDKPMIYYFPYFLFFFLNKGK